MPLPCRSPRRWLLNQLAMAALLLLALGAGFLLLWQAAVHERANETWLPNSVVSSLPGYAEEIVFQATFAADELPAGATEAVFYRTTLEPGANLPFLSAMAPFHSGYAKDAITTGVAAEFVESGSYEVVLDAPVSVQLGGSTGAKSEIAPRQTIALGPGDIAVYRRATAAGEIRNRGVDPVEVIGVAIVDFSDRGVGVRDVLPAGVTTRMLDATTTSDWTLLPAGPKQVTLRRVTLPARALLPPFQPRGLESIWVARGAIAWSFASNAASAVGGQRIHRQAGGIAPFVISPHGAQRILESTGDEPAELLVLTIEPAGLGGNPLAP